LTAGLVATQWNTYRRGVENVQIVHHLQLALRVMQRISAERAPSNGLLGANQAESPAIRAELVQARSDSDRSIDDLLDALDSSQRDAYRPIAAGITALRTELAQARQTVDRLAGQALAQRHSADIGTAVNNMIALTRRSVLAATDLSAILAMSDPVLRNGVANARLAASLLEYAEQIGSQFTAAVATGRPLRPDEVITIAKLNGRAEQLRFILELQLRSQKNNRQLEAALNKVDIDYFGNGLPMLNGLLATGLQSGEYGMSTGRLAALYAPKMKSIVELGDLILNDAVNGIEAKTQRAKNVLSVAIGLAGLVLAIFYWLLRNIRNRLVTPVLESASLFVALANGELDTPIPKPRGIQEIGNLFRAMEAFKASCVARIDLEREREALITQLQASSDTDFLTGLLNRRAFYTYGEPLFAIAQRYRNDLALILMDIDYFKQVNDRHGHQIGDIVLQQVASLCLRMHRKVDLVARYGGEEFLMLLPHTSLEQATAAAEKLRAAIAAHSLTLPSGTTLDIRASFGVAAYRDDATLDTLIWRADQALYSAKDGGRNQVQRAG
jgi:diguanylate cyclase (GGDEF)-like protein